MPSPFHPIAAALVARTTAASFNLVGFLGAAEFDACQPRGRRAADLLPGCGTIFLFGHGGGGCLAHMAEAGITVGEPDPDYHPIDEFSAGTAEDLRDWLAGQGIVARATFPDAPMALNFMHLAEMAGWGTISPVLGILLHPEFGPWVSMRGALLLHGTPFGVVDVEAQQPFQPCLKCHKPCVDACPIDVFDGMGDVALEACARHRHAGFCSHGCDARRACPVGAAARFGQDEERFRHAYSLFSMRRHFGLGPASPS